MVAPLLNAAQEGHLEICKFLVGNITNKTPAMNNGITPPHSAAHSSNESSQMGKVLNSDWKSGHWIAVRF